jgi:hypothetical protein
LVAYKCDFHVLQVRRIRAARRRNRLPLQSVVGQDDARGAAFMGVR